MDYKYEVAFTLANEDKEIARQINMLIKNKFSTFLYFENKEETGAKDGLNLFYDIFKNQSRIVVVLFSEKWSQNKWTTKEEQAIKDRIVNTNWNFLIFVKIYKKLKIPEWYPNSEIFVDFEEYGYKGVASVIENKVRELGGTIGNESIEQKAKRISEEKENNKKIQNVLNKQHESVKIAEAEVANLISIVEKKIKYISENSGNLNFKIHKTYPEYVQIFSGPYILHIRWWLEISNYLDGAHLDIGLKKKRNNRSLIEENNYDNIKSVSYVFNINKSWQHGWSIHNLDGKFNTSDQLIDFWLNIILDNLN